MKTEKLLNLTRRYGELADESLDLFLQIKELEKQRRDKKRQMKVVLRLMRKENKRLIKQN